MCSALLTDSLETFTKKNSTTNLKKQTMKINPTINFNQDASSIIISDLNNLRILQIENQIELHEIYSSAILKDSSIAERLYNSSLLVVVRKKHPRTLKVYHFRKNTEICAYSYSANILSVKVNRARLVVTTENAIYFHDTKDMTLLHSIKDIPFLLSEVNCLCQNEEHSLFVYPGSSVDGLIHVFEASSLRALGSVCAHKSVVSAMAIFDCKIKHWRKDGSVLGNRQTSSANTESESSKEEDDDVTFSENQRDSVFEPRGHSSTQFFNRVPTTRAILATASQTGTVVRLWAIRTDGLIEQITELRRGTRSCKVSQLAFDGQGKYLALISDTETVHVWYIENFIIEYSKNNSLMGSIKLSNSTTKLQQRKNSMKYVSNTNLANIKKSYPKNGSTSSAATSISNTTNSSWLSWTSTYASNYANDLAKSMLPTNISSSVTAERSFITAQLPSSGKNSKIAIQKDEYEKFLRIFVLMEDCLLVYEAELNGGEARVLQRRWLMTNPEE